MKVTKPFLIIVDLQKGFLNEHTKSIIEVIENAKNTLDYEVCVFTKFYNDMDTSFSQILNWKRFQSEEEQELVLKPCKQDVVISKNTYSAVTQELRELIKEYGCDRAYICGIDTDACVLATAFELFDNGIEPLVVIDACASSSGNNYHAAAELIMRRSFGNDNVNNLSEYIGGTL